MWLFVVEQDARLSPSNPKAARRSMTRTAGFRFVFILIKGNHVLCTWLEKGLRRTSRSGPDFLIWRLSARAIWPSRVAWQEGTVRPRERCQFSNRLSCTTRGGFGLLQRPFSIPRPLGVDLYFVSLVKSRAGHLASPRVSQSNQFSVSLWCLWTTLRFAPASSTG